MGDRVDLPSGAWAEFRDPHSVTNRERRPLVDRAEADTGPGSSLVSQLSFGERLVILMVDAWSYDMPLPRADAKVLDDLPAMDLDKLMIEVAKDERRPFLFEGKMSDPKASPEDSAT